MHVIMTLMRMDMGRRSDDFTADIVDAALALRRVAGRQAAQRYLDANLIDPDISRRVLGQAAQRRRAADSLAPPAAPGAPAERLIY